jgi:hypothetical protein
LGSRPSLSFSKATACSGQRHHLPTRRFLSRRLFNYLYQEILNQVHSALDIWSQEHHATPILDGWESVAHQHIVNLLAVFAGKTVFIDSLATDHVNQTANMQAELV